MFILTSNLGADAVREKSLLLRKAFTDADESGRLDEYHYALDNFTLEIYPALKGCFKRDEIIGRINQTVVFLPFEEEQITELVQHQLELWRNIAMEEHSIELTWSTDGT